MQATVKKSGSRCASSGYDPAIITLLLIVCSPPRLSSRMARQRQSGTYKRRTPDR
jgi:hypothetical protein